jgi:leucyl-tRNA synthetase
MSKQINFPKIEKKWQARWEKEKAFITNDKSKKQKYYILEMYPYPSASGLHMGHAFQYLIGDILARLKRMQGYNVLHPMGFDSFGLPAENAAIKAKTHPKKFTNIAIAQFIKQMKSLGFSYDWSRCIQSHDPNYYKWNQYFFLEFLKNNLVFRKKAPVNFCPDCKTVLANEQVIKGKCWRHLQTDVEIKPLKQWFIKTTKYSEELLSKVDQLDWPQRIKIMQKNWIGKSHGTEIIFEINGKNYPIFTTRPDTIYGVTFMVISAQHPKLNEMVTKKQEKEIKSFLRKIKSTSAEEMDKLDKVGVFTGSYAINPLTKEEIPVYAGNFVLADYGSGIVMAVPAHDQRDYEFAKKYNLSIKHVIKPNKETDQNQAYTMEGVLINSGQFSGLESIKAKNIISEYIEKNKLGKITIQYKLRDWLVSRQRYWGTPIPIIYCDKCGIVSVPEKDLPILLPEKVKFGKGNPLKTNKDFVKTKCPDCNGDATRETDTMDTFFDSSWYFLRFIDSLNLTSPFDKLKAEKWMPVDFYTGGAEHACLHLIYSRFFTKALRYLKFLNFNEPFSKLFNQGMLHGSDGFVMSKSRGNVVDPLDIIDKFGTDSLRLFLISVAGPDSDFDWSNKGFESSFKFANKIYNFLSKSKPAPSSPKTQHKINKAIKEISIDLENIKYNLAIIKIRTLFSSIEKENLSIKDIETIIKLISPVTPHLAEELWHQIGNKSLVSLESWPIPDEAKINPKIEFQEQAIEKTFSDIQNILKIIKDRKNSSPTKIYIYTIPSEKIIYDEKQLSKKFSLSVKVFASNDINIFDPENKAKKAKPNKPGIYIE